MIEASLDIKEIDRGDSPVDDVSLRTAGANCIVSIGAK